VYCYCSYSLWASARSLALSTAAAPSRALEPRRPHCRPSRSPRRPRRRPHLQTRPRHKRRGGHGFALAATIRSPPCGRRCLVAPLRTAPRQVGHGGDYGKHRRSSGGCEWSPPWTDLLGILSTLLGRWATAQPHPQRCRCQSAMAMPTGSQGFTPCRQLGEQAHLVGCCALCSMGTLNSHAVCNDARTLNVYANAMGRTRAVLSDVNPPRLFATRNCRMKLKRQKQMQKRKGGTLTYSCVNECDMLRFKTALAVPHSIALTRPW